MAKQGRYLEIILRETGPEGWPALTLELQYPFCREVGEELKAEMPRGTRIWDGDGTENWHCHPDFKDKVVEIGYRHFDHVYFTEGDRTVEVRSGQVLPTQTSFLC